ncbi:MAG: hypothetical protein KKA73_20435 [Chloroflexi bacterium]|nr:hypothetical protein [Chloroflexota bacterium]MBU1750058.1 hypothetical protein [Chloroflexota bacterium]MBU1879143.1 hypothetical protein [Chloroflexota bacterium]
MLRNDYVLRLAAQFTQALAHILGLNRRRDYPAALVAIDEALDQLLGLRLDAALDLSEAQLLAVLTLGGTAAGEGQARAAFLAALLREAGTIHAAQDRPIESYECRLKALHLLLMSSLYGDGDAAMPSYAPSVAGLVADLDGYILPAGTNLLLSRYYEGTGEYARAEDALFEALEAEPGNADALAAGQAFYDRLQQHSDEALAAGNLPRDEVAAGRAELGHYRQEETD